jgi:hypothetical protein
MATTYLWRYEVQASWSSPLVAVLMEPAFRPGMQQTEVLDADIDRILIRQDSLETVGLTPDVVRFPEQKPPTVTPEHRVSFALLAALRILPNKEGRVEHIFRRWAEAWLYGEDRTEAAATSTLTYLHNPGPRNYRPPVWITPAERAVYAASECARLHRPFHGWPTTVAIANARRICEGTSAYNAALAVWFALHHCPSLDLRALASESLNPVPHGPVVNAVS